MNIDFRTEFDAFSVARAEYVKTRDFFWEKFGVLEKNLKCPACGGVIKINGNPLFGSVNITCTRCHLSTGDTSWEEIGNRWFTLVDMIEKTKGKQEYE